MDQDTPPTVASARSWLFTPGTRPDRFSRAADSDADAMILDLEDSVSPEQKDDARANVLGFLAAPPADVLHAVRINSLGTMAGLRDLLALLEQQVAVDAIVLPKSEGGSLIAAVSRTLDEANVAAQIVPLVESARGLETAAAMLAASGRIGAVMLGAADLAADLGAQASFEALLWARGRLLATVATARISVIDSPFFDVHDTDGLTSECSRAAAMGFTAKGAIHPGQVATINATWTPTPEQLKWARKVVSVNQAGIGTVDGEMVDEAVARRARRLLERGSTSDN